MPRSDGLPPGALRRAVGATAGPFAASITTKHFGTPFEARRGCYLAAGNPCEDIVEPGTHVRFGSEADIEACLSDVRFTPKSRTSVAAIAMWTPFAVRWGAQQRNIVSCASFG